MGEYYFAFMKRDIPRNVCVIITDSRTNGLAVYADHVKCFDKLSKCPIVLPFPQSQPQAAFLLSKLKWLSTRDGYKASNYFLMETWVLRYPEDIA